MGSNTIFVIEHCVFSATHLRVDCVEVKHQGGTLAIVFVTVVGKGMCSEPDVAIHERSVHLVQPTFDENKEGNKLSNTKVANVFDVAITDHLRRSIFTTVTKRRKYLR